MVMFPHLAYARPPESTMAYATKSVPTVTGRSTAGYVQATKAVMVPVTPPPRPELEVRLSVSPLTQRPHVELTARIEFEFPRPPSNADTSSRKPRDLRPDGLELG
jgi:hypothetical protein